MKRQNPSIINDRTISDLYQQIEQISRGSYGRVYKVRERSGKRQFRAVKQMRIDPLSEIQWEEVKNSKSFLNDHIVEFYCCIVDGNQLNIVMNYCKGNLRDQMNRKTKFQSEQVINLMIQVTSAMLALSQNHIMHLDLKPENILFQQQNYYKLCDFGHSQKIINESNHSAMRPCYPSIFPISMKNMVFGTAQYIAPEVQLDLDFNMYSCDIWSFGVILYEIVYGKHPIGLNKLKRVESIDFEKFMGKQLSIQFSHNYKGYPTEIIEKMLKPDPKQRLSWNKIKSLLIQKYGRDQAEFMNLQDAIASQIKMSLILASLVNLIDENMNLNQNQFWKSNKNQEIIYNIKILIINLSYLHLVRFDQLFAYKKKYKMSPMKQLQLKYLLQDIKSQLQQLNPQQNIVDKKNPYSQSIKMNENDLLSKLKLIQMQIKQYKSKFESVKSLSIFYEQFKEIKSLFCKGSKFVKSCECFEINQESNQINQIMF